MMMFLDQIYIIVLSKRQVMKEEKNLDNRSLLFGIYCGRGQIYKNIMWWNNYALRIFSKSDNFVLSIEKSDNITRSVYKKTLAVMFSDFL